MGLAVAALFFTARQTGFERGWSADASLWFWAAVSAFYAFTWVLGLVGLARTYATKPSRALAYATEAVYPFYIFHQTITVAIVYWLIPVPIGLWTKLAIAAVGTFGGSWALFEIVRRIHILRPLVGLKVRTI